MSEVGILLSSLKECNFIFWVIFSLLLSSEFLWAFSEGQSKNGKLKKKEKREVGWAKMEMPFMCLPPNSCFPFDPPQMAAILGLLPLGFPFKKTPFLVIESS